MSASNGTTNVVFDTLQDFLRDEAGVAQISRKDRDAIEKAWDTGLVPMILLKDLKIMKVTDHQPLRKHFVVCVRGNGFDAVQLKALNEAIIGAAQGAGLSWPFATDNATNKAR